MAAFKSEQSLILRLPFEMERVGFISKSKAKKVESVIVDYRSLSSKNAHHSDTFNQQTFKSTIDFWHARPLTIFKQTRKSKLCQHQPSIISYHKNPSYVMFTSIADSMITLYLYNHVTQTLASQTELCNADSEHSDSIFQQESSLIYICINK